MAEPKPIDAEKVFAMMGALYYEKNMLEIENSQMSQILEKQAKSKKGEDAD